MKEEDKEALVQGGLMSVGQAMEYLSVSRSHIYELMDSGEIPFAKVGRCRRIPRASLVRYVASRLVGGGATGKDGSGK